VDQAICARACSTNLAYGLAAIENRTRSPFMDGLVVIVHSPRHFIAAAIHVPVSTIDRRQPSPPAIVKRGK